MCEDARPVHKMMAVTSARPKMVASNLRRQKFRSVTLHSAKEKRNVKQKIGKYMTIVHVFN